MSLPQRPQVGVAVLVLRDGRVLMGQRLGALGTGTWALPGGHLEFGESFEQCARREVREETGLELLAVEQGPCTSQVFEGRHYVTIFMQAQSAPGEPSAREPAACAGWHWFDWAALPAPLFPSLRSLREAGFAPAPPDVPG